MASSIPVAVLAMSCHLPGAASVGHYWDLLLEGRCAIEQLPPNRLNRELYYDERIGVVGKTYTTLAGLVPPRQADLARLRLDDQAARTYDAPHLLICELVHEALSQLGDPFSMSHLRSGVYMGATTGSTRPGQLAFATLIEETAAYLRHLPVFKDLSPERLTALVEALVEEVRSRHGQGPDRTFLQGNMAARLVAQVFGFSGPTMLIDAACASSLQALMQATRALQQGHIDMAVVGGVSCFRPDRLVLFSHAQSVSARGSFPFDARADGLVVAEGYASVVLKTLQRARADRDPILAVIRGIGMSTDGRGKSLWAPRRQGQILAIERAYRQGLDVKSLGYVEAHATSTQIGDATELAALQSTLSGRVEAPVALGSCKGNLGHCLETAGLAGLLKTILAVQHGVIPPACGLETLNPAIDWDKAPFYVPLQAANWPSIPGPRRAAVNAFGVGGLNVHVVVEEYLEGQPPPSEDLPTTHEPVAVIGVGAIFPGALNAEEFWNILASGADATSEVTDDRWNRQLGYQPGPPRRWKSNGARGGFIRGYHYDWRKHKVPPRQVAQANPLQFLLLDAAQQALTMAGLSAGGAFDRQKVGVVVGTLFDGDFQHQLLMCLRLPEFKLALIEVMRRGGFAEAEIDRAFEEYREELLGRIPALLDETGSFTSSTLASRITKTFDLQGGAFCLDSGANSGLEALSCALDLLRSGDCEMILCAAGQRRMDLVAFEEFSNNGLLDKGVVPGEGVGVLLLKPLAACRRDGDQVLTVIREVSRRVPAVLPPGVAALQCNSAKVEVPPGAVTPLSRQFGHLGAGGAMAGLVKTALACQRQVFPPGTAILVGGDLDLPTAPLALCEATDPAPLPIRPRVAWMFVGQGSQYGGMLQGLVEQFPPAAAALQRAEEALSRCACPPFRQLAWEHPERMGGEVWETQLATLVADYILAQSLESLGMRPDVVAGHSFGEIAALITAGVWDLDTAIHCVRLRTQAMEALGADRGGMVAVSSDRSQVEKLMSQAGQRGRLYLSNHNAPTQYVLSGEPAALERVLELAGEARLNAVRLNVPCAFHSPIMLPAQQAFTATVDELPLKPARIPVLSTASCTYMMEVKDIRLSLCDQFSQPVLYSEMVGRLAEDHRTLFVEVGPQRVLTRLHSKILGNDLVGALASDDSQRPGLASLLEVRELLRRHRLLEVTEGPGVATAGRLHYFDATARRRQHNRGQSSLLPEAGAEGAEPSQELRDFLISFIVEETGYPAEMVDLDAHLEADLGLDSIKIAQLFGEIRERFRLDPPTGGVSFDDFLTLRSILDYLARQPSKPPVTPEEVVSSPLPRQTMTRHVLELAEAPAPSRLAAPGPRRAFVLGDNPDAVALVDLLHTQGWEVVSQPDPLEAVSHLFLFTARDGVAMDYRDAASWGERRERGVMAPYLLCQQWYSRLAGGRGSLIAVTALGGDFGLSGSFASAESGALAGLVKAVARESEGRVAAKVLDFPHDVASSQLARRVLQEVVAGGDDSEVAPGEPRRALRVVARGVTGTPVRPVARGGTWLVSGGARGITAYVALRLALHFDLRLHVVGSSPLPQIEGSMPAEFKQMKARAGRRQQRDLEIDRCLTAYKEAGVNAIYHQCDVSDREQVARLVAAIGPVDGVLHGAGVESAASFSGKRLELVEATLASKVDGAAVLLAALEPNPPRHFVAFGSVSGRFGGIGQTDYSMANEMLSKLIAQYRQRHPECAALCLVWPAWAEIGMASRPESLLALQARNVTLMPPDEGWRHLLAELQSGLEQEEVIICDPAAPSFMRIPAGPSVGKPVADREAALAYLRAVADRLPDSPPPTRPPGLEQLLDPTRLGVAAVCLEAHSNPSLALLEDIQTSERGLQGRVVLASDEAFLRDHTIQGRSVLPGVVSAEALLEAAHSLNGCQELRNLQFLKRLDSPHWLAVAVEGTQCRLLSANGQTVAEAEAVFTAHEIPLWEPRANESPWVDFHYPEQATSVRYGPSLRTLYALDFHADGGRGRLRQDLEHRLRPERRWLLPAALLDGCLVACGTYAWSRLQGRVEIPIGMDRLVVYRHPEADEECLMRFQVLSWDAQGTRFDFQLAGFPRGQTGVSSEGRPILEVKGYRTVGLTRAKAVER